jgi:hypothetical protein
MTYRHEMERIMTQSMEEHHNRAADHFDRAADYHRAAEKASIAGDHKSAAYHAQLAAGHSVQANDHSDLAAMAHLERHTIHTRTPKKKAKR